WGLLGLMPLIVLFIAFLPTLLVAPPVLQSALPYLNNAIEGELTLGSCSVGWNKELECSNVDLALPRVQLRFSAQHIQLDKPLYQLLFAPRNIGKVTLVNPVAVYQGHGEGEVDPSVIAPASLSTSAGAEKKPFWDGINVQLVITEGEFVAPGIASALGAGMEHLVRRVNLEAHLEEGTVTCTLDCLSGEKGGALKAVGFFNLPITHQPIMKGLVSSTDIQVQGMELGGLLHLLAKNDPQQKIPAGSGMLTTTINLTTSGVDNIGIKGAATIADLQLEGGMLGTDKPAFEEIKLNIDLERRAGKNWNINTFTFDSALLTARSNGTLHGQSGSLQGSGVLYLPFLMQAFPSTLKLKEGVSVTEGVVEFEGFVRQKKTTTSIQAEMSTSRLAGTMNGQFMRWDDPFLLELTMQKEDSDLFFNNLHVNTSFLDIQGSGSLDNFRLTGQADLQKSCATLGNFVAIPYVAQGQLSFASSTSISEDQRYQLDTSLRIKDFLVRKNDVLLVPPHPLTLSVRTKAPHRWGAGKGVMDLTLRADTWLGTASLLGSGMQMMEDNTAHRWVTGDFDLEGNILLEPMTNMLQQFTRQEQPVSMAGVTHLQSAFRLERDAVHIRALEAEVDDFAMQAGDVAYQDRLVRIGLHKDKTTKAVPKISISPLVTHSSWNTYQKPFAELARINFSTCSVDIQQLSLDTGLAFMSFMSLAIADWKDVFTDFSSRFSVDFEVDNVVEVLHQARKLDPAMAAQGRAQVIGAVQSKQRELRGNASLKVKALTLNNANTTFVQQEDIRSKVSLEHTVGSQQFDLPVVAIDANLLRWMGRGAIRSGDKGTIFLQGKATPDFGRVGALCNQLTGKEISLNGKKSHDLALKLPLNGGGFLASLDLDYKGVVEQVRYQGIRLENTTFNAAIKKGNGTLKV
ncbi:MAG: hypothetical protein CSA21_06945, partial [Deltaproteobacteria bacterium]